MINTENQPQPKTLKPQERYVKDHEKHYKDIFYSCIINTHRAVPFSGKHAKHGKRATKSKQAKKKRHTIRKRNISPSNLHQ